MAQFVSIYICAEEFISVLIMSCDRVPKKKCRFRQNYYYKHLAEPDYHDITNLNITGHDQFKHPHFAQTVRPDQTTGKPRSHVEALL